MLSCFLKSHIFTNKKENTKEFFIKLEENNPIVYMKAKSDLK